MAQVLHHDSDLYGHGLGEDKPYPDSVVSSGEIAPRSHVDLSGCINALLQSHRVDRYPMSWPVNPLVWLSPPELLSAWTAKADGQVVGHVVLTRDGDGAAISRLFVVPAAQRRGLAVALLDAATEYARAAGHRLELTVVEDSVAAIQLYERLGWTLVGREPAPFTWPDGTRPVQRRYFAPVRD